MGEWWASQSGDFLSGVALKIDLMVDKVEVPTSLLQAEVSRIAACAK